MKSKKVINVDIPPGVEDFVWFEDGMDEKTTDEDESLELEVLHLLLNYDQKHESVVALTNKPKGEEFVAFDNDPFQGLDQEDKSDEELEREILFLLQQKIENH